MKLIYAFHVNIMTYNRPSYNVVDIQDHCVDMQHICWHTFSCWSTCNINMLICNFLMSSRNLFCWHAILGWIIPDQTQCQILLKICHDEWHHDQHDVNTSHIALYLITYLHDKFGQCNYIWWYWISKNTGFINFI